MKSRFLFPRKWRVVGWVLLSVEIIILTVSIYHSFVESNQRSPGLFEMNFMFNAFNQINVFDGSVQFPLWISGLFLIAFSKERIEDEHIAQIRLESLQWAIYINYALFIIAIFVVKGFDFFGVALYNVITPLIIFVARFKWIMFRNNRSLNSEAQAA